MTATDPIDEARLGLLLGELRLPGIKLIWSRFAERADKEGWPAAWFLVAVAEHELAERERSPSGLNRWRLRWLTASSATSRRRACRPARASTALTSTPSPWSPRPRSWPWSPATAGSRRATTCSCSARPAAASLRYPLRCRVRCHGEVEGALGFGRVIANRVKVSARTRPVRARRP